MKELTSERLRIATGPVRLKSLLPEADLAVVYGGLGVMIDKDRSVEGVSA